MKHSFISDKRIINVYLLFLWLYLYQMLVPSVLELAVQNQTETPFKDELPKLKRRLNWSRRTGRLQRQDKK